MATALDIITRAMRLIGQLEDEEEPSASESADGLVALNELVESMDNEEQFIRQIVTETFTWPGATASRSIGDGGNFDTVRPMKITEATFIRSGGSDYPLSILTDDDYAGIADKSATGTLPFGIYCDRAFPLANLYLVSVPDAAVELHLASWKAMGAFSGLTTQVELPPGYNRMLRTNLAVELAPEFGVEAGPTLVNLASRSRAVLQPTNKKMERMQFPSGMPGLCGGRSNILTGE